MFTSVKPFVRAPTKMAPTRVPGMLMTQRRENMALTDAASRMSRSIND